MRILNWLDFIRQLLRSSEQGNSICTRLSQSFGKKRSGAYEQVRKEVTAIFEKDLQDCNLLIKISDQDKFLLEMSISNTFERLKKEKAVRSSTAMSHAEYDKMLLEVANEMKNKYVK